MKDPNIPSVAVCIPTYNQSQYLELAVRSACEQNFDGGIEVWVSDDASTDDTPGVMQRLCAQFSQLNYYRQPQNGGISVNNSWLMRRPQTKYLVRLDSDDLLLPNYVKTLVQVLEENPRAGYAHTAIQYINKDGEAIRVNRLHRESGYHDAERSLRDSLFGYRTAANVLMFRSQALKELSYYDGRPEFVEDYDLSIRMADAGYGNFYQDQVLAAYRIWSDDENKRVKRKKLQISGYVRIFDEVIKPAYARRGWNLKAVRRQRQRLAVRNVASCSESVFSIDERKELQELLVELGASPQLSLQLALCRNGFAPFLETISRRQTGLKVMAKNTLKRFH